MWAFHVEAAQRTVQEHRHPNACRISDIFWHLIELRVVCWAWGRRLSIRLNYAAGKISTQVVGWLIHSENSKMKVLYKSFPFWDIRSSFIKDSNTMKIRAVWILLPTKRTTDYWCPSLNLINTANQYRQHFGSSRIFTYYANFNFTASLCMCLGLHLPVSYLLYISLCLTHS